MNAARDLFLAHGVAATTIEQITAAAQVAKGTFYLYFASKEAVLAALTERFAQQLRQHIEQAVDAVDAANWRGKLAAWAAAGIEGYLDAKALHDILFHGTRVPTREGMVDNIIIDHLCALLEQGMAAKAWSLDEARFSAVFLFSALHGIVDDAVLREKRAHRPRLTQRLQRLCLRVVAGAG